MSNLKLINTRRPDGTYTISYVGTPDELNQSTQRVVYKLDSPLQGIDSITTLNISVAGQTRYNYAVGYFRYDNGAGFSGYEPIDTLTGLTVSPCSTLDIEIMFTYVSDNGTNVPVYINNLQYGGLYTLTVYDANAVVNEAGGSAILSPYDVYKIFRLDGFQVLSNHTDYDILYRITQDGGRTYSAYAPLTTENIQRTKFDKLRFAQLEYHLTNNGSPLMVYDIILLGDFQNVNANYLKTNRYGLKEDCTKVLNGTPGMNMNALTDGLSCYKDQISLINSQNSDNASNLFKPYQTKELVSLANLLGNQVSSLVGWYVEYHLTDPDAGGIDTYIHEYTLKNTVDMKRVQIVVPENKFPTDTIIMNQFNLNLFDTFEIHIMKDVFKNAFGVTSRPSEDDVIYFCEANALFTVRHAQAKRDIMNASTYYRVVLEKHEQKANVRNLMKESSDMIAELTNNTTLDGMFGEANAAIELNIANKEQTKPRTQDLVRHKITTGVNIVEYKMIVDNFEPIQSYYDLSDKKITGKVAVDYKKADQLLSKGDNRAITAWVNFNNHYSEDTSVNRDMVESYNIKGGVDFTILDNYDASGKTGYSVKYRGGMLHITINGITHSVNCSLLTNVWYCVVVNMDQRNRTVRFDIYRRNSNIDILLYNQKTHERDYISYKETSAINDLLSQGFIKLDNVEDVFCTGLELVMSAEVPHEPVDYASDLGLKLIGSDMKVTNIRVLKEVIPADKIIGAILEYVMMDQKYIILADNSGKKLMATNYVNINWK